MTVERALIIHYAEVRRRCYGRPKCAPRPMQALAMIAVPTKPAAIHRPQAWKRICDEVAEAHAITLDELVGRQRHWEYSQPRREAMWRVRNEITVQGKPPSWAQIGMWFGRNHATCIFHVQRYERENGL